MPVTLALFHMNTTLVSVVMSNLLACMLQDHYVDSKAVSVMFLPAGSQVKEDPVREELRQEADQVEETLLKMETTTCTVKIEMCWTL